MYPDTNAVNQIKKKKWRIISVQKITLERIPHMADSVPDVWFACKDIKNHKLEQICGLGLMPAVDTTSY